MKYWFESLVALAVVFPLAGVAYAQDDKAPPKHDAKPKLEGKLHGVHEGGLPIERLTKRLGLSKEQVEKLKALNAEVKKAHAGKKIPRAKFLRLKKAYAAKKLGHGPLPGFRRPGGYSYKELASAPGCQSDCKGDCKPTGPACKGDCKPTGSACKGDCKPTGSACTCGGQGPCHGFKGHSPMGKPFGPRSGCTCGGQGPCHGFKGHGSKGKPFGPPCCPEQRGPHGLRGDRRGFERGNRDRGFDSRRRSRRGGHLRRFLERLFRH